MVREITDREFQKTNQLGGVGGCQDRATYELEDQVNGLRGQCCKTHATLHNLGANLKELHEEAIEKIQVPFVL
jgi:hypothetical protein